MPALPASTNRSRQFPTVAEETPCRRAASPSESSPFNTANTTWICSSTDTCRDGFCDLLTQTPFVTGQPSDPATKSDALHSSQIEITFDTVRCISTTDQLLYSALHGIAMRYAAERRSLDESIEELREIADGRNDILAEAAGITAGCW